MYKLPDIRTADVKGKMAFLLSDLDVPLSEVRQIEDDTRLKAGLPTIAYLLEEGAKIIIGGKLGRPQGENYEARIKNQELSLQPVASWFAKQPIIHDSRFIIQRTKIGDFEGWEITPNLFLLENLRFYQEEENNDPQFAQKLASLADFYINDAFAMCHRSHASVVGVAEILPHFAGLRLQKEIGALSQVLKNPQRPLVVVIGGKKVETKLPLVAKMILFADKVLVGGLVGQKLKESAENLIVAKSNDDGTDISEESVQQFKTIIKTAKTIVWNGPVGKVQGSGFRVQGSGFRVQGSEDTERGTREVAQAITETQAYKIVGGGDTTEFLKRIGLLDKFDFVSTGGGAMLAFLSGEKLPGLEVLVK